MKEEFPSAPEDRNNPQVANSIVKYTDEYFKDHAILLILKTNSSGSIRDQYTALTKTGKSLTIEYTNWIPHTGSADVADWRVLLEVRKSDVLDVATITAQQQVITLPSGVPIPKSSDYP